MGQRCIDVLKIDVAVLRQALKSVHSPLAQAQLTDLIADLHGAMGLGKDETPSANENAAAKGRPMIEEVVGWF